MTLVTAGLRAELFLLDRVSQLESRTASGLGVAAGSYHAVSAAGARRRPWLGVVRALRPRSSQGVRRMIVLAGDVGGTKCNLGLFEAAGVVPREDGAPPPRALAAASFASAGFSGLGGVVAAFVDQ